MTIAIDSLKQQTNQLQDRSLLMNGKLKLDMQRTNLFDLLKTTCNLMQLQANPRKVSITMMINMQE